MSDRSTISVDACLVSTARYPTIYTATGLKVDSAVASPLTLDLITTLGLLALLPCCGISSSSSEPSRDRSTTTVTVAERDAGGAHGSND